jgi:hypothetical protein
METMELEPEDGGSKLFQNVKRLYSSMCGVIFWKA